MDQISKKIKMISQKLKELKNKFNRYGIDGYLIPKNDEYFSEFAKKDKLKTITGFDGSFGLAIILKKKNFLFVDGRYVCLLYTSPSPRDLSTSRMPSSA